MAPQKYYACLSHPFSPKPYDYYHFSTFETAVEHLRHCDDARFKMVKLNQDYMSDKALMELALEKVIKNFKINLIFIFKGAMEERYRY